MLKQLILEALEALFADDFALLAHKKSHHQPPVTTTHVPTVSVNGTQLKAVETFKYLGSTILNDESLTKEINTRICKSSQAIACLHTQGVRPPPYLADNKIVGV